MQLGVIILIATLFSFIHDYSQIGSVGIYGTYDISIWGRALINYVTSVIKLNGLAGYSQLGS